MSEKYVDKARNDVAGRLRAAGNILAVTHSRPDGDTLGSAAALARSAAAAGKSAAVVVPDDVPPRYAFLTAGLKVAPSAGFAELADAADAVVILDTHAMEQLEGLETALPPRRAKAIVVDHHATGQDIAAIQWVDASAAAAGVMTAELLRLMAWPLPEEAAEALAVAITSDTGWLRFANTDARCIREFAALVEKGVRPDKLYERLFLSDRAERLLLIQRMLGSLRLHSGGRVAIMRITADDFFATGAARDETENLVNEALRAGSVQVAALLVQENGRVRVSLRSRGDVDVAAVAASLGGGGHARASGAKLRCDMETAADRVLAAVSAAMPAI